MERILRETPVYIKNQIDWSFFIVDIISKKLKLLSRDWIWLYQKLNATCNEGETPYHSDLGMFTGMYNFTIKDITKINYVLEIDILEELNRMKNDVTEGSVIDPKR